MKKYLKKFINTKLITAVLVSFVVLLAMGQLLVANAYSTKGADLRSIEQKIDLLREENRKLKNQIS